MHLNYLLGGVLIALLILRSLVKRLRHRSLSHIVGPPSISWLAGNFSEMQRPASSMGDIEFAWIEKYGSAMKIQGPLGTELLYLSDPKGMQYVCNTSGYNFPKSRARRARVLFTAGPGIVFAEGGEHARHRRVMNPAFSYGALKGFLPLFFQLAEKLAGKWKDLSQAKKGESITLDVTEWLSRMTLDAIGEAAFNDQFNALDNSEHVLVKSFSNLFFDSFSAPADTTIAAQATLDYLPYWMHRVIRRIPTRAIRRLQRYMLTANGIAGLLVARERDAMQKGKPAAKDAMSILVRANDNEDPRRKLGDKEIYAQLTTLMLAGHETTSSTLAWMLYEISKRPDIQCRIRDEVKIARATAALRGDKELTVSDLESMNLTVATVKETLRFHPIASVLQRVANHDDVIPLSVPQRTTSGEYVTSIPVSKGQEVVLSIMGYNRLKNVWGTDADQWKPERFIEGMKSEQKTSFGVIANLATFSSGVRNCIGWRFAMLEMQAALITLLENFEFSPADVEIERVYAVAMLPMVKGQRERGGQMPLVITPII